jgi:hypothetical protein
MGNKLGKEHVSEGLKVMGQVAGLHLEKVSMFLERPHSNSDDF